MQNKYKLCGSFNNNRPSIIVGGGLLLIILLFTLASCGMPTYAYLYPPVLAYIRDNPETIPDQDLIFTNAYNNNASIFSGYEIYYKIYDPSDSADNADMYIDDKSKIASYAAGDNTELENNGFSRLYISDKADINTYTHSEIKPAFLLPPELVDENFRIRLKFLQELPAASSFLAETFDSILFSFTETPYLYRRVLNSSTSVTSNKYFDVDDFDIYDNDMPSSIDQASSSDYLYITFFILSYGRDIADITKSVYSTPLYLGTLRFDCSLTGQ